MKESEWHPSVYCSKCKRPLMEHDEFNFGTRCPYENIPFEDEEIR